MAKKIVAVTGIKHGSGFYPAGEKLDPANFTKDELRELHDNGAIMVADEPEAVEALAVKVAEPAKTTPETPKEAPTKK